MKKHDLDILDQYIRDYPEQCSNIMAGVYAYGFEIVKELLEKAQKRGERLEFYYKTDEDLLSDILSFRFV